MTEPGQDPGMPPDDRELEEFLAGRSPLSRAWREEGAPGAPPELDEKVLELAREELRRARAPRRLLRWDGPLALAASTLVVLGLAWLTQSRLNPPREAARDDAVAVVPVSAAPASSAPAAEAPRQAEKEIQTAPAPTEPPLLAAKLAPPARRAPAAGPPRGAVLAQMYGANASVAPAPPAAAQPADKPVEADALSAPAQDRSPVASESAPPPPAPFPASPAPAAAAAPAPLQSLNNQAGASLRMEASRAKTAADPCAAAQRDAALKQAAPEARGDSAAWLEQVRRLRDAGSADAAKAELACYAARNPQAEIPDDLRPLLPAPQP